LIERVVELIKNYKLIKCVDSVIQLGGMRRPIKFSLSKVMARDDDLQPKSNLKFKI